MRPPQTLCSGLLTMSKFVQLMEIENLLKMASIRRQMAINCYSAQIAWKFNHSANRCLRRARKLKEALVS